MVHAPRPGRVVVRAHPGGVVNEMSVRGSDDSGGWGLVLLVLPRNRLGCTQAEHRAGGGAWPHPAKGGASNSRAAMPAGAPLRRGGLGTHDSGEFGVPRVQEREHAQVKGEGDGMMTDDELLDRSRELCAACGHARMWHGVRICNHRDFALGTRCRCRDFYSAADDAAEMEPKETVQ